MGFTRHLTEDLGHEVLLHGVLNALPDTRFRMRLPKTSDLLTGTSLDTALHVGFDADSLLFFNADGARLRDAAIVAEAREAAQ